MTDAAHLLSDVAGFAISLFALYAAAFPRSRRFNFGWHRAEVVGALGSILVRGINSCYNLFLHMEISIRSFGS